VIARRWRVWARRDHADEVEPYLRETGVGEALRTDGNRGALLLRDDAGGDEVEFTLVTFWVSIEAVRAYAGEDYLQAVLYPADREHFSRWDAHVSLLSVPAHDGLFEDARS
jgi:heme-degrading monooxygenase HmoA